MRAMTRRDVRAVLWGTAVVVGAANLLHRVVFPAPPPNPATFPRTGDSFGSAAEGVTQDVVDVRDGWLVLRSRVRAHAEGPPRHVHPSFAEPFTVASGSIVLHLPDRDLRLGAGDEFLVPAGTPHHFSNPSDQEAIIAGQAPAMPQAFGACLVQVYHFLDAAQGRMGPGLLLRIAAMDSVCDGVLSDVPAVARVGLDWLVLPFARPFGYEDYYPELSLHPQQIARR
jgi:mannose-6-phosphate isomerase-like protein (cupin superfamily)